jgi:hypothetical protein
MGTAGMKRKGRSHLPKVRTDGWPQPDDVDGPLFGQFRWSGFSPAGALERSAWFWRQVARHGTGDGWRWGFDILRVFSPVIIWLVLMVLVITALLKLV